MLRQLTSIHVSFTHRLEAILLIVFGFTVFAFASKISTLKSTAWARFYQRNSKAAERNLLSVHAGTERSIRLGGHRSWHRECVRTIECISFN